MPAPSDAFIQQLPKAELHLHLEGAIAPDTVVELARNHGHHLDPAAVRNLYHYTDFTGFLMAFRAITEHLQTPDDYELVTYRLMEHLATQNVVHAEVYIAVGTCVWWGRSFEEVFEGMERGRLRGERDFGMSLHWIFDAVRHFGPEAAFSVAERAVRYMERGSVVGFGIGGDERRAAPELFKDVYDHVRERGLHRLCHAGESVGPESVWGALNILGAERIGHGLTVASDARLVEHLARTQVPVEISVSSNVRTRCVDAIEQHPLRQYFDAGILVTLNTDDPAMFETTLNREYGIARDVFGFSADELAQLARNSFAASFLPEEKKQEHIARIDALATSSADDNVNAEVR